jgi:methionine sulfoxide reductase heme-binding subunit
MALSLGLNGTAAVGWHAAARSTAIFAYGFWLFAFSASPLAVLFPNSTTRAVLIRRRAIGLAFTSSLGVHALAILRLATLESEILLPNLSVLGGALGIVFVGAMAATSNDAAIRRLGRARWRQLHQAGQIFLLGVFAVIYGGRFAEDFSYWPGVALLVGAFGLRGAARLQSERLRSTRLPTE